MSNLIKKDKGFTLIEIVLVLAIAGLLLVIVFLAVSGAQKSRRDSQRKQDNARVLAQMESFASNHSGVYPTSGADKTDFTSNYINTLKNPDGGSYSGPTWKTAISANQPTLAQDAIEIDVAGRSVRTCLGLEQGTTCVNNQ